jgi:hypothetical protein
LLKEKLASSGKKEYQDEVKETEDFLDEEDDENDSPGVSLSEKNKYVLNANSSKLARKPYYKVLQ